MPVRGSRAPPRPRLAPGTAREWPSRTARRSAAGCRGRGAKRCAETQLCARRGAGRFAPGGKPTAGGRRCRRRRQPTDRTVIGETMLTIWRSDDGESASAAVAAEARSRIAAAPVWQTARWLRSASLPPPQALCRPKSIDRALRTRPPPPERHRRTCAGGRRPTATACARGPRRERADLGRRATAGSTAPASRRSAHRCAYAARHARDQLPARCRPDQLLRFAGPGRARSRQPGPAELDGPARRRPRGRAGAATTRRHRLDPGRWPAR